MGIFACAVFSRTVNYMVISNKYKDKLWDAQITTAGDYTAFMKLNEKNYRNYQVQRIMLS